MAMRPFWVPSPISSSSEEPTDFKAMSLDDRVASPENFARWLLAHADLNVDAMSRRRLLCLYAEFCDYFDFRPWPIGRFDRALKLAGFQRRRLSSSGRPWVYGLLRPGSSCRSKSRKHREFAAHPGRRAR